MNQPRTTRAPKPKTKTAWQPPEWELADAYAIQKLIEGKADEAQQKRAIDWIINKAAQTYDMAYRPESARDTDFALGRAFVGQQIVKLIKLNLQAFK